MSFHSLTFSQLALAAGAHYGQFKANPLLYARGIGGGFTSSSVLQGWGLHFP